MGDHVVVSGARRPRPRASRRALLILGAALASLLALGGDGAWAGLTWSNTSLDFFDYCAHELNCQRILHGGEITRTGDRSAVVIWTKESCDAFPCSDDPDPSYSTWQASTTDTGLTWSTRSLGWGAVAPTIASRGARVDAAYVKDGRLLYRRSIDGGTTWRLPKAVSPSSDVALNPRIARGPAGRVAIAWRDGVTGQSRIATSTNDGYTFGTAKTIGANGVGALAIGGSTVYASYYRAGVLRVRRSPDGGMTWPRDAISVISNSAGGGSLAADGPIALVGYRDSSGAGVVRRTANSGVSWQPGRRLAATILGGPLLETSKGVWRTAFNLCLDCLTKYRRSLDGGLTWSTASTVASRELVPLGVGAATKPLVLGVTDDEFYELVVRRGE